MPDYIDVTEAAAEKMPDNHVLKIQNARGVQYMTIARREMPRNGIVRLFIRDGSHVTEKYDA